MNSEAYRMLMTRESENHARRIYIFSGIALLIMLIPTLPHHIVWMIAGGFVVLTALILLRNPRMQRPKNLSTMSDKLWLGTAVIVLLHLLVSIIALVPVIPFTIEEGILVMSGINVLSVFSYLHIRHLTSIDGVFNFPLPNLK